MNLRVIMQDGETQLVLSEPLKRLQDLSRSWPPSLAKSMTEYWKHSSSAGTRSTCQHGRRYSGISGEDALEFEECLSEVVLNG